MVVTGNNHGKNGTNSNNMSRNKKLFLEKYLEYGTVGATMKAIGLKRRETFYDWCRRDAHFKKLYETELLPNRRDEMAALMYRYASGKLGDQNLPDTRVRCMFGFLKATDHVDDPADLGRLVFCEKNQVEIAGAGGGAIKHDIEVTLNGDNLTQTLQFLADAGVIRLGMPEGHKDTLE